MTNINDPIFDEPREHPGFRALRARLSRQAGSERLGLSCRTPDGGESLQEGEVVPFLRGEQGGHQLVNRTEDTVPFLAFSTNGEPDIVLYLECVEVRWRTRAVRRDELCWAAASLCARSTILAGLGDVGLGCTWWAISRPVGHPSQRAEVSHPFAEHLEALHGGERIGVELEVSTQRDQLATDGLIACRHLQARLQLAQHAFSCVL